MPPVSGGADVVATGLGLCVGVGLDLVGVGEAVVGGTVLGEVVRGAGEVGGTVVRVAVVRGAAVRATAVRLGEICTGDGMTEKVIVGFAFDALGLGFGALVVLGTSVVGAAMFIVASGDAEAIGAGLTEPPA